METKQEEMQFLGIFGMFRESYNILLAWRCVFAQIAVSLILPLAFVILVHLEVSDLIFSRVIPAGVALGETRPRTPSYNKTSDLLSKEWAASFLFTSLYLVLALLSTAAVVHAIACIYTGRDLTFSKVMSVVPHVWDRFMYTSLCIFTVDFVYALTAALIFWPWDILVGDSVFGLFVTLLLGVAYMAGYMYMTMIWQLASVVTVLEEDYGFRAMAKSRELLKGRTWAAAAVFFLVNTGLYGMKVLFEKVVVCGEWIGENMVMRVGVGVTSLQLVSMLMLMGLAVQTVIYFVCKSYHHENIDKSALSSRLKVYQGEDVPLKAKDMQLQEYDV